jgi:transposase-like protein
LNQPTFFAVTAKAAFMTAGNLGRIERRVTSAVLDGRRSAVMSSAATIAALPASPTTYGETAIAQSQMITVCFGWSRPRRHIGPSRPQEALTALLGKDAPNLSPAMIARLKGEWEGDYRRWLQRDLAARRCLRLGGRRLPAGAHGAECMLVLIGATPEGKKELVGFQTGQRESLQSWKELLVEMKACWLAIAPEVAVGDGALGFWKALDEAFPSTRHQRRWVHKTINVLDKLPKSVQSNAHRDLRETWMAPNRAAAEAAIDVFAAKYAPKYRNAVDCLIKDPRELLTFYDLPTDHWDHLRTSNPIESVFATVRHRTVRMKGALSPDTARVMVFKLVMAASKTWRRLKGQNQLSKVVRDAIFGDGVEVETRTSPQLIPAVTHNPA